MKMRIIAVCVLAILGALPAAGQIDPSKIGKDQAQQQLVEVSISKLEDAAFWHGAMALDDGIVTLRSLPGSPAAKKPAEGDVQNRINEQDTRVLGVKVDFYHRGVVNFTVHPTAPLPIAGLSKTISVWIAGRNFNHTLKILIDDYFGRPMELTVGKLTFMGWKKLTVAVPPSITQTDYHFTYKDGIKITGFKIECDPLEAMGTYYLYFDDIRVVTDLFGEARRDSDDMTDGW
ncbi:MAG: flagellar filament protein FlaA [Spirochaetes bacterium RBG_13_68_11]|nr:MAG: flagellar filament protein FlaA [Spirochaetes bacterium RBG_13_68_11]